MTDNIQLSTGSGGDVVAADDIGGVKHQRVKLSLGADGAGADLAVTNPMPLLSGFEIARGNVSGLSAMHKFGKNPDIDTANAEDLWDGGGDWVPPTTARTHDITSTSINDTSGGSGARTVTINGLDASGEVQSETVTMNGTSDVATAFTYTMIYRMYVETGGSGEDNAGTITATAQTDSTVTAQINPGENQTLMAIYQVPSNATAYMTRWYAGLLGSINANVDVVLMQKLSTTDAVWRPVITRGAIGSGASTFEHTFDPPQTFAASTLLKIRASTSINSQSVFGGFDLILDI